MGKIKDYIGKHKKTIPWIMASVYGGYAVSYLMNITGFAAQVDKRGATQSALAVIVFLVAGYFQRSVLQEYGRVADAKVRRRRFLFALILGSALGLSFIWGYKMRLDGMTSPGYKDKLWELLMALGLGVACLPLTSKWFALLERIKGNAQRVSVVENKKAQTFWYSFLAIIVCWIPVFLAYYPAIMSYDFNRQSGEAYMGYIWFNDHHPLVHTFLIRMFLLLGETIGSYELGMAFFSIMQMLILAAVLAYSGTVVGRITGRVWPVVIMVVIYALLPIHPVLALCMTKDILFTAFFLLMLLLIWEQRCLAVRLQKQEVVTAKDKRKRIGLFCAILVTGILTMLLRNNAVYAFVVFAVFYVIIAAGERVRIAILCLAIIGGGLGCKTGIREAMGAGSGSSSEMFSVMMQQFARVGQKQSQSLTEEEWSIIAKYVPEELWDEYNPPIADTIKGTIAAFYYDPWKEDIPGMLADWVKIGVRYPNEYIDAFLALTSGYWFLDDVSHAEVLGYGEDTDYGLIYTFNVSASAYFDGVESKSVLPALQQVYQKIINGNCYYNWPVVSILFKPAFYCWTLLLVIVSLIYKKEPKKQLMPLFPFIYLLTLFLGPVVNIRYVYPIMVIVPVLLAEVLSTDEAEATIVEK